MGGGGSEDIIKFQLIVNKYFIIFNHHISKFEKCWKSARGVVLNIVINIY